MLRHSNFKVNASISYHTFVHSFVHSCDIFKGQQLNNAIKKTNLIHLTIAAGAGRGGVSIWAHLKRLDVWIEKGIMPYSIYFIATSKMPRAKTIVYDSLWNVHLNRWE